MSTSRHEGNKVKVVIINTEYIETDARSFKSVVQKLTGKDVAPAKVIADQNSSPSLRRGMSFKENLDNLLKLELPSLDNLFRPYEDEDQHTLSE
ncbi:unnamed protein product [Withania somnifera]